MAVFEYVDIIDDQHRLWRCDRLWKMVIEVRLDRVVFPGAFANEAANPVFVNCEPFADTAESFVSTRADQAFNIRWSNVPRIRCS